MLDPLTKGAKGIPDGFDVFATAWDCSCGIRNPMPGVPQEMLPKGMIEIPMRLAPGSSEPTARSTSPVANIPKYPGSDRAAS